MSLYLIIFVILKKLIFVNNIDTARELKLYLLSRLFFRLQKKATIFIQTFLANLEIDIRLLFFENFCNKSIRI